MALALMGQIAHGDPLLGDHWTTLTLHDPNGKVHGWQPGRVTVFEFYASWCDTWKQQMPRLEAAERSLKGLPYDTVRVSVDGRWQDSMPQSAVTWLDSGGEWSREHGIDRVPSTVVVDREGIVRFVSGVVLREHDFVEAVHHALQPISESGEIHLIFDTTAGGEGDEGFLDQLRQLQIQATIMVNPGIEARQAKWLKRAKEEGHCIVTRIRKDRLQSLGQGAKAWSLARESGHILIDPLDQQIPGKKELLRRILPRLRVGAIILLHPSPDSLGGTLPTLVERVRQRGYQLTALH